MAFSVNDVTVPYSSAAIEADNPFVDHKANGFHIVLHEEWEPLIKLYSRPLIGDERPSALAKSWRSFKLSRAPKPLPVEEVDLSTRLLLYSLLPILVPYLLVQASMAAKSSKTCIRLLEEDGDLKDLLYYIFNATADQSSLTARSRTTDTQEGKEPSPILPPPSEVVNAAIIEAISTINKSDAASTTDIEPSESSTVDDDTLLTVNMQELSVTLSGSPSSLTLTIGDTIQLKACSITAMQDRRPERQKRKEKENAMYRRIEITPPQQKIVDSLSKLPIKRERAFFPNVRNTHAYIICRDPKRFETHRAGEGVIRHWAHSFIL